MYILDRDTLVEGDIILTRSSSRDSLIIRQRTNCNYSHAVLYVGSSSCIESDGLGVQSQNLQRLLFENEDDALVLRLKEDKLKQLISDVIVFARQKIGTEYSTSEAKLANNRPNLRAKEENRQFCTRFVAQAFFQSGIQIVENPDYCTPNDLQNSPIMVSVANTLRIPNDAELEFAKDTNSPLEKQKDIHNYIFENARAISGEDIQTFEQLANFVLLHHEKEKEITNIIESSGYLDMWKGDIERNPGYYDFKEFLRQFPHPLQRKEIGRFFATTENETRERYYLTLQTLEFGYSKYKQRYFEIQIELYKKLIELSETREFVGILALSN